MKEVIFFYQLKSLTIEGRFQKQDILKLFQNKYVISYSNFRLKLNNLIKLGWVEELEKEYKLIKYDKFFEMMGYERERFSAIKRLKFIIQIPNRYKIFKIETNKLTNLVQYVAYEEIKLNFKRQAFAILQDLKTNPLKKTIQKKLKGKLRLNDLSSFNDLNRVLIEVLNLPKFVKTSKYDISLSCKGIAKLMGFTSVTMGFHIERFLMNVGLLEIKNRFSLINTNYMVNQDECNLLMKTSPKFIIRDNMLWYIDVNKLII